MRKRFGFLLMIGVSTLSLSGCLYQLHRTAGPCYGTGCPAFSASSQPKVANAANAPSGNALTQTTAAADSNAAAAPSQTAQSQPDASQAGAQQEKPGVFTRMLTALHLHSKS